MGDPGFPVRLVEPQAMSSLSRDTAAMINPLIGACRRDTLIQCRDAVDELGFLVEAASGAGLSCPTVLRFFSVVAAAMSYEIGGMDE